MMFKNLPRSSSPISKDKDKTFAKDFATGLSFPGDFLDETGDSTRSLLGHPGYSNANEEDNDNQNREEENLKSTYDERPSQNRLVVLYSYTIDIRIDISIADAV